MVDNIHVGSNNLIVGINDNDSVSTYKNRHGRHEKPTYMLHALCTMMLLLPYFLEFTRTTILLSFYARTLLLKDYCTILYYYLKKSCMHIRTAVCICIQLSRRFS